MVDVIEDFVTPGTDVMPETASQEDIVNSSHKIAERIQHLVPEQTKQDLQNRPGILLVDVGAGKTSRGTLATLEALNPQQKTVAHTVDAELYGERIQGTARELIETRHPTVTVEPHYGTTIQQFAREQDVRADVLVFSYFEAAPQIPVETIAKLSKPGSVVIEVGNVGNLPDLGQAGFRIIAEKPSDARGTYERVWQRPGLKKLPSQRL